MCKLRFTHKSNPMPKGEVRDAIIWIALSILIFAIIFSKYVR